MFCMYVCVCMYVCNTARHSVPRERTRETINFFFPLQLLLKFFFFTNRYNTSPAYDERTNRDVREYFCSRAYVVRACIHVFACVRVHMYVCVCVSVSVSVCECVSVSRE